MGIWYLTGSECSKGMNISHVFRVYRAILRAIWFDERLVMGLSEYLSENTALLMM